MNRAEYENVDITTVRGYHCKCGSRQFYIYREINRGGQMNIRMDCAKCGKYQKYLPKTEFNLDLAFETIDRSEPEPTKELVDCGFFR